MKFCVYIAASVDGFVATSNGGVEWLDAFHDTEGYRFGRFLQQVDAIVMGRKTFDQILGFGKWPYRDKDTYVLTSRPIEEPPPNTVAWADGAETLASHLRETPIKGDVWIVGGPESIKEFRDIGSVDEYQIYTMPVLLGSGIPLFQACGGATKLRLMESHTFKDGVVKVTYRPK